MSERPPSRIQLARQRVAGARRVLAAASLAAFGAAVLWAHGSHPGTTAPVTPASSSTATASDDDGTASENFDFGEGSLAPSAGAAPDTSSHAS
jgi:hypothetical protein